MRIPLKPGPGDCRPHLSLTASRSILNSCNGITAYNQAHVYADGNRRPSRYVCTRCNDRELTGLTTMKAWQQFNDELTAASSVPYPCPMKWTRIRRRPATGRVCCGWNCRKQRRAAGAASQWRWSEHRVLHRDQTVAKFRKAVLQHVRDQRRYAPGRIAVECGLSQLFQRVRACCA